MNKFHAGWYLIYTKPRHEKKVHSRLTELNIKSFLPTKKTLRAWHDRRKYIDEPLFPSYIFIFLDNMENYYQGISAEGSLYYVKTGKGITRVAEPIINNIKLVTDQAKDLEVSESYIQPGRRLVISQGALAGLSCEVIQCDSMQKLLVRVDLLQRNILLTLTDEYLTFI